MSKKTQMQVIAMAGTVTGDPKWEKSENEGYASFYVKNTPYVSNCKQDTTSIFHVKFRGVSGKKAMDFLKDGLFLSFEGKMMISENGEPVIYVYSVTPYEQSGGQSGDDVVLTDMIKKTIRQSIHEEIGDPIDVPKSSCNLELKELED